MNEKPKHWNIYKYILRIRPAFIAVFIKKLIKNQRFTIETTEGKFHIDPLNHLGFVLIEYGEHESSMTKVLKKYLNANDTFVDLGANEGYFTIIASKLVGPYGKVISVEPQKRLEEVFFYNLKINQITNVEFCNNPISNCIREAFLNISPDTNPGSTALFQTTKYRLPKQRVETITLSELFKRYSIDKVNLLKIDIESFEYDAILGSPEIFKDLRVEVIALELHPTLLKKRGFNPNKPKLFLEECGYRVDNQLKNLVLTAPNKTQCLLR